MKNIIKLGEGAHLCLILKKPTSLFKTKSDKYSSIALLWWYYKNQIGPIVMRNLVETNKNGKGLYWDWAFEQ